MKKEELIAIRRDLHRIPELGFQEFKTQQYLLNVLEQYPQDRIEIEKWRTGLFVKVNGTAPKKCWRTERISTHFPLKSRPVFHSHQSITATCTPADTICI